MTSAKRISAAVATRLKAIDKLRGLLGSSWVDLWALIPVLVLIGLPAFTIVVIGVMIIIAMLLGPILVVNKTRIWGGHLAVLALCLSVVSFGTAVTSSLLAGCLLLIAGIPIIYAIGLRASNSRKVGDIERPVQVNAIHFALLYGATLTVLGWNSLRYYTAALAVVALIKASPSLRVTKHISPVLIPLGFVASLFSLRSSTGQFWLSFDQVYRSSLAVGLSKWGIDDHIGATGTPVRYHWLGEAVSGVISRLTDSSAVISVTRIVPALGVAVCLRALLQIGNRFGFTRLVTSLAAFFTMILGQVFEVFSVGSLWGIALFLVGILSLERLVSSIWGSGEDVWHHGLVAVVIAPLIAMSQSTLGIHFVMLTAVLLIPSAIRSREQLWRILILVLIQLVALLLLRQTLLSTNEQHFYTPVISPLNILKFRGVEIYAGFNSLYVVFVSILFLLVISQMLAGLVFVRKDDWSLLRLVLATSITSLFLANVFSIGVQEAQQARFLVPLITIGTFFSLTLAFRQISTELRERSTSYKVVSLWAVIAILAGISVLFVKYYAFSLPWSQKRTVAVGAVIVAVQAFLITVVLVRHFIQRLHLMIPLVTLLITAVALTADGRQIKDLIGLHQMSEAADRAELITGSRDAQQCLTYVRDQTSSDSIIASNWYRIPIRWDAKYFLVSATTERRTFVDGPSFVGYPRSGRLPTWLEGRISIVDGFAERASPESYEVLRSYGVEYFLVDRLEVTPATWQPYADVVLENERCFVLKLSS